MSSYFLQELDRQIEADKPIPFKDKKRFAVLRYAWRIIWKVFKFITVPVWLPVVFVSAVIALVVLAIIGWFIQTWETLP